MKILQVVNILSLFLCFHSSFANFCLFLLNLLFVFFPRNLTNGRCFEQFNEVWYYVIQLVIRLGNDFLKLKYLFLIISSLGLKLSQNVDELGSEHHVQTHIDAHTCPCVSTKDRNNQNNISKNYLRTYQCIDVHQFNQNLT